jgi:epoxyqueuosine reductase
MDAAALTALLKQSALAGGLDDVGVCAAGRGADLDRLDGWLARGDHAGMWYMERRRAMRVDPGLFFPGARSALMVVKAYDPGTTDPDTPAPGMGVISRHAVGPDYHLTLRALLEPLKAILRRAGFRYRAFTDAAPVMEKVLAVRAGLGVMGTNTLLTHPRFGSWVYLGGILTDAGLVADEPLPPAAACSSCRRCIDACPGGALREDGTLDGRRCLSYWTAEAEVERFPDELSARLGGRLFGCDRCQEVCPMNRGVSRSALGGTEGGARFFRLDEMAALGEAGFDRRFGGTTLRRLGWPLFKRNVDALRR